MKHRHYFKKVTLKGKWNSKTVIEICKCKETRSIKTFDENGKLVVLVGCLKE